MLCLLSWPAYTCIVEVDRSAGNLVEKARTIGERETEFVVELSPLKIVYTRLVAAQRQAFSVLIPKSDSKPDDPKGPQRTWSSARLVRTEARGILVGEGVDIAVTTILRVLTFSLDFPVGPGSLSRRPGRLSDRSGLSRAGYLSSTIHPSHWIM